MHLRDVNLMYASHGRVSHGSVFFASMPDLIGAAGMCLIGLHLAGAHLTGVYLRGRRTYVPAEQARSTHWGLSEHAVW